MSFGEYLREYSEDLILYTQQHALLTLYVLLSAAVIGVGLAMLVYRKPWSAQLAIGLTSISFTIPSIAALPLATTIFGRSLAAVYPVLVMYALLPIVRNTIVGLRGVDATMVDAARGMGMSKLTILRKVEFPLAWPVILAGLRVSAMLTVGLIAIAAFIVQLGLGQILFSALDNLGSVNTLNQAMAGTLLVAIIAVVLDVIIVALRHFSTPRGLRV